MKLLQSALVLCVLVCGLAQASQPNDNKCGCSKPKPNPAPSQVVKPVAAPQKTVCAPAPDKKDCAKPKA